jgi:hypothetical protein
MANTLESDASSSIDTAPVAASGWLKVGVIATASVLAGGLAAAWWYRNTLRRLQQADECPINPEYGIFEEDPVDPS